MRFIALLWLLLVALLLDALLGGCTIVRITGQACDVRVELGLLAVESCSPMPTPSDGGASPQSRALALHAALGD